MMEPNNRGTNYSSLVYMNPFNPKILTSQKKGKKDLEYKKVKNESKLDL